MDSPVARSEVTEIRIGSYVLELGSGAESFARFEPEAENENARAVAAALAQEEADKEQPLVAAVEELDERATAVTDRIERANELVRAAAEGRLLDGDVLASEIDASLALLERLDRDGRFEDELRLARSLHRLLLHARRWLDLIRSLQSALRAAEAAGDPSARAWAQHELGSLALGAGDPRAAEARLEEALQIQQQLGAAAGRCATRHNLDCARRDAAVRPPVPGLPRRLLRLAGLVAALVLVGGGGAAVALGVGGDGGPGVRLSVVPGAVDLGRVAVGDVGEPRSITAANSGDGPLALSRIEADDPAVRVESDCGRTLAPGERCALTVRFAPLVAGAFSARLPIAGEGVQTRVVTLSGHGVALREPVVDPAELDFGAVPVGRGSEPHDVVVAAGLEPLVVQGVDTDRPDYLVEDGCRGTLMPESSCTVRVRFRPSERGARSGTLIVSRADGAPLTVRLRGTGSQGVLAVSPGSVEFGRTVAGTRSAPRQVLLSNLGDAPITPRAVLRPSGPHFELASGCDGHIAPGATCTLSVTFTPAAVGPLAATVVVEQAPDVPLRGIGADAPAEPALAPGEHDFGAVEVGTAGEPFPFTLIAGADALTPDVRLSGSGDFLLQDGCSRGLAPAGSCTLEVTFRPTGPGPRSATLVVEHAGGPPLTARLAGLGTVVPSTLSPPSHDFGRVAVGRDGEPFRFTLAAGSRPLAFAPSLSDTKDFRLGGTCAGRLERRESCTLEVVFAPSAGGPRSATVTVTPTDGSAVLASDLAGTGVVVAPTLDPASHDFGRVLVRRQSARKTFTLTAGSAPLPAPVPSARGRGDFLIERNECGPLAAFASCTFDVVFAPTVFGSRRSAVVAGGVRAGVTGFGWAFASWGIEEKQLELWVPVGEKTASGTVTVAVSPKSAAPLLTPRVFVSGANFRASGCKETVAVGFSCTVEVVFEKTGPIDDETATLIVWSRNGSRRSVPLSANSVVE